MRCGGRGREAGVEGYLGVKGGQIVAGDPDPVADAKMS